MRKPFPIFLSLMMALALAAGCAEDRDHDDGNEPPSHDIKGWKRAVHINYVKTAESVYSCNQCQASLISDNRKCDNSEGACHTGNPKPSDHTAGYLKAHKVLNASTQVSNSKPYCLAWPGLLKI